ncbi:MAG: peroxiredoxin [Thiotrichaceae bacterium]|jgi:peroxiredoxin Q/BCP|uniref:thioredoxin-dependent peroxiredoxin n=1 Tax=Candidatus Thiocaldithrix dubininis TaxID=3080823 RepID=A0AA95H7T7_9GAMM|nr:MAG: peroxiredoxin [Candidatus Thiocaldithrix dubininis]
MTALTIGQSIPHFSLPSTTDQPFQLSDYLDQQALVIYFYPKDNTPGCTTEGQDFRNLYPQFKALNVEIVGVSRDSVVSHSKFKTKLNLPFALLSDTDETICKLFDVIKLKTLYGKTSLGIERSTFLIDKQGILRQAWRKVAVKDHAQTVLEAARTL